MQKRWEWSKKMSNDERSCAEMDSRVIAHSNVRVLLMKSYIGTRAVRTDALIDRVECSSITLERVFVG